MTRPWTTQGTCIPHFSAGLERHMALFAVLEAAGQFTGLLFVLAILADFLDSRGPSGWG